MVTLNIIVNVIFFAIGMYVLAKGADAFVDFSAKYAREKGISEFLIGLILIGIGTSLPELAINIQASLTHNYGIVIGNVVGSNMANIGLILSIPAFFAMVKLNKEELGNDTLAMFGSTLLFIVFAMDGIIDSREGLALLIVFFVYLFYLIKLGEYVKKHWNFHTFLKEFLIHREKNTTKMLPKMQSHHIYIFIGLAAIVVGSYITVKSAEAISIALNINEQFIGLTLIAVGSGLPELSVSYYAVKKGLHKILVGNILGSNIGNLLLVGGAGALLSSTIIEANVVSYLLPALLIYTALFCTLVFMNSKLTPFIMAVLLAGYGLFLWVSVYFCTTCIA